MVDASAVGVTLVEPLAVFPRSVHGLDEVRVPGPVLQPVSVNAAPMPSYTTSALRRARAGGVRMMVDLRRSEPPATRYGRRRRRALP